MHVLKKPTLPSKKLLLTNYIGGLGYYSFHIAWMLLAFLAMLRFMQFIVLDGVPVVPAPEGVVDSAAPAGDPMLLVRAILLLVSVAIGVATMILVVCLPYWIGSISRNIPTWILRQTSWSVSRTAIVRTKFVLIGLVFCISLFALFSVTASLQQNAGFLAIAAACVLSGLFFWIQDILTALWKLPQRSIF